MIPSLLPPSRSAPVAELSQTWGPGLWWPVRLRVNKKAPLSTSHPGDVVGIAVEGADLGYAASIAEGVAA